MTTFISYSRVNSDFAVSIAKDLRSAGFDIWLDQLDIPAGARWDDELEKALNTSTTFLVILSPESSQSQNVKDEIGYAIDSGKHILPVLIKNCNVPLRLRRFQYVDFTDDSYKESLDQIKRMLGNTSVLHEGHSDPGEPAKDETDAAKPEIKWKPLLPYIVVGGVILIALVFLFIGKFMAAGSTPVSEATSTAPAQISTPVPAIEILTSAPTNTALPDTPTLTPIPPTDTPVPTFTDIPPVALGQDWTAGCISSLWKTYPATPTVERGDGCWVEPVNAFSAENGDLDFLSERGSGSAEVYGLFAPLPESGTVTFTVRLRDLHNVDLWMGVFPEPDVASQGLLMTILNGDVSKRSVVQKNPLTYDTLQGTSVLNQGNGYSISFTFTTLSATSMVNPSVFVTNQVSIRSPQKWLFLGYKGLRGAYRIDGTFLNFTLTGK